MLFDRPRRVAYTQKPPVNPLYTVLYNPGTTSSIYSPYPSQEPFNHMYMTSQSHCSSTESNSSKSMAPLTCVVAPSAVDRNFSSRNPLGYIPSRKQREFIPANRKDYSYWEKREKNNEAARRSRERKRIHEMILEKRFMDLRSDYCQLRNELILVKTKYGLPLNEVFIGDEPTASTSGTPGGMTSMTSHSNLAQLSPTSHPVEVQQKYTAMPHSPVRGKNLSGAMYFPYHTTYPTTNNYPPSPPPALPYISRDDPDPEIKAYSGKLDAPNPHSMKSMQEETQTMRVDDQFRPVYSTVFPSNMAPPYPSTLPVSSMKSYWVTTTEMASSHSNNEGDWDDLVQEQPLSLVKRRPSTGNESGSEMYNKGSTSPPPSSPVAALPHKLRHKYVK